MIYYLENIISTTIKNGVTIIAAALIASQLLMVNIAQDSSPVIIKYDRSTINKKGQIRIE